MRFISPIILAAAVFLLTVTGSLLAQENSEPSNFPDSTSSIENSSQIISVDKKNNDEDLAERLNNILSTIDQFENLSIKVQSGLVFLEGESSEQRYIELATEISKNLEGVVAVVNNLGLKKKQYLSAEPIKNELQRIAYKSLEILPLIFIGIIIFSIAFLLSSPVSSWLSRPISLLTESQLITTVIKKLISVFVVLIGLYFFLRLAGLTQFAVAIISGTGVMGLILGFAFRDIAENFMSSLLLSVQRPFRLGDVISVQGHKGIVRKVTARGTTLVDFDGNHIQIPNSTIYKNIIHNFSANPKLRGTFSIGIGYDTSIVDAQKIISDILSKHIAVLDKPDHQVLIENLGSSTINLIVYFWVDSHEHAVKKVASIMMRLTVIEFTKAGISMPDDAREVIFPDGIPGVSTNNNAASVNPETKQLKQKPIADTATDSLSPSSKRDRQKLDDLSSDVDDIREQAASSRDPEAGENIL